MRNSKLFAVMLLTAAAVSLPGCTPSKPADEVRIEQPAASVAPTETPKGEAGEQTIAFTDSPLAETEQSPAPSPIQQAQKTSPPKITEPVTTPAARAAETKSAAETAAPTSKPTAERADAVSTTAPKPTATPTPTPVPQATAAPASTSAPIPEATSVPTPTPHVHSWTKHEATGHYEMQKTGTEDVAVGTDWEEIGGWDENRSAYFQCNDCGETFSSNLDAGEHILSAYHGSYSYYPAETIHHDGEWVQHTKYETRDVYGEVWIVDSEAYWSCACGETRDSQP